MAMIILVVFIGVFSVAGLVLYAAGSGASQRAKQVQATLDSALATESQEMRDQIVNLRKNEQLSAIPWINNRLSKLEIGPKLQALIHQANLNWTAGSLLAMCGACFAVPAFIVHWKLDNTLIALPVGLAFGFLPIGFVLFKRSKRFNAFEKDLPSACDLMVSALRAGQSLIAAMGMVAREMADPLGGEFSTCFEEQNFGLDMKVAIDNLLHRVPLQDLRIVCTAILIQKESGGNLAEVLDKTAHVIRERFRLRREVQTRTAQGRMTGYVLTLLPIILGIALYFVNPTMMSLLWKRDIGVKLLWTASGMIVVGGLIIRKIVNMDV
ncbi:MAG TPA: type II secretion system F family protein [Terracidiphilus sp.]|jgi:tight adherence protein B|nr:type II secretion system F family protein [Terracidiphilus sp.]